MQHDIYIQCPHLHTVFKVSEITTSVTMQMLNSGCIKFWANHDMNPYDKQRTSFWPLWGRLFMNGFNGVHFKSKTVDRGLIKYIRQGKSISPMRTSLTQWGMNKRPTLCRRLIEVNVLERISLNFDSNLHQVFSNCLIDTNSASVR